MFKNYFKTALRNIRAHKLFTSLNVTGLAIGLCVCITLFAYTLDELSYDRMYRNADNIYRINLQTGDALGFLKFSNTPNAVAPAISRNIPQIISATRLVKSGFGSHASLKTDNKVFSEKGLYLADSTVFRIFDFDFIEGNAMTAFKLPKSIVLSQSVKEKLFGHQSALGKLVCVNSRDSLYVSGIYKDPPENSTIDCDMVSNIMDSWMGKEPWWSNPSYETFCLLQPHADIARLESQVNEIMYKNIGKDTAYFKSLFFQSLTKIHLYSAGLKPGYASNYGNISSVKMLVFLSLVILIIACINYMNLATAQAQKRTKGIGVNKVLGASIRQMMILFYAETALLSFVAIVLGYFLAYLSLPVFQNITGIVVRSAVLHGAPVLSGLFLIWLMVTIIAGSYPAISMSRISLLVLINKAKQKSSFADITRKSLVVFQFAASIVLIIAVIIILQQIQFIGNKDLGYNPKGVVSLSIPYARQYDETSHIINQLKSIAGMESISAAQSVPGDAESGKSVRKSAMDELGFPAWTCRTDGSITKTMQLQILAGTTLPLSIAKTDTNCYTLINEVVATYLGFKSPQEAVGRRIITEMSKNAIVTGVVKNFNYRSLKDEIGGYVYYESNGGEPINNLLVRYNTANLSQLMRRIQDIYKTELPNSAFEYEFLDKRVQNLYKTEQRTATAAVAFSGLAIFIACLGLFGLVSFMAEQRTKEIGIRKVLGASISGVALLLVKDFLRLLVFSFMIATPVAWWAMNKWLQGFVYRIHISWLVFVAAGTTAILIALTTAAFQTIKTAIANPVISLRSE
jgi:putative ABC transport system permease protein